ncbi:N,N-dimethylformamidase beta subunit family domain-containing protein [Kiloniella sp. b19]|uniref:N,N-dimethylformamidase beta subunit family domain-containing protein n=1 Tax=Kiloniella sp. GXU_MW_B19 TaxID=3141326 RepID=UPI0031E31F66
MTPESCKVKGPLWGGYSRPGKPDAVHDCYYQKASNDPAVPQLWAYTDALSYAPGRPITLHLCTTAETCDLLIFRDGFKKEVVFEQSGLKGHFHETPEDCSVKGCNWPAALQIPVGEDWASGAYVLELSATAPDGTPLSYDHILVVRPAQKTDKRGRLLFVLATSTWTAYNDWGGSNHYEGITGANRDHFSPVLSLQRPYARGFVRLPADAPRVPLREAPEMGAPLCYPHLEWPYENGYSKKYASTGWASYDRAYLHWLEEAGYAVDLLSETDLHYRPELVEGYSCLTFNGHSEYWSWEMRDCIDSYVERGGNIARFAGNFLWQIRLEDEGRTQVCYKYIAREEDPQRNSDQPQLTTTCWDALETGRPGAQTFGLSGTRGIYAGWGGCTPRGAGGFTIYRPEHWIFEGADLYYGDVLGAPSRLFGYEVDGVDHIIRDGLPAPTGSDGAPENLEILALGLATLYEADHGNDRDGTATPYIGSADAEFAARAVHGAATPELIERYKRGSGMIALFKRGKGTVLTAGTCEWVAGLIDRDPQVERITGNILDRFLNG